MNVYVTAASCDGSALGAGDEIALFDGAVCVGLSVLTASINSGTPLAMIASTDDPTTTSVDGFTPNRPIVIRIWKAARGVEYPDSSISRSYSAGAGTYGSLGTAVVSLSGHLVTGVGADAGPPGFQLFQNYPNPFNGSSDIGFRIAEFGWVQIQIFDLLGRVVATPVDEVRSPGAYVATFDGSQLASGVYVCRMTAGKHVAQTKLILQR